ncbi:MAG: universal stress protein UspE [Pseudomonadales bacterium]|jgi:universal stress protein E|nr:universal stress protein UspE [Pseudomonadales bacterium]MDP7358005.1 universal stress protein UspE [Pseudomonadales bacterium]MDP7594105.1 universal stress protein UspE [Pseudomonadales bacterium]HJN50504.1 universal stress protein UspE [Pseudomonadales bacterium]|tara:strand:- start:11 stop:931 length:921 start_codon:yes stop_codon:yes gene_type:complete
MKIFKKIFVVLEPQQQEQPALERAGYLAKATDASLHLFVCAYDTAIGIATFISGTHRKNIIRTVVDGNQVMVDRLAAPLREDGIEITTEVVWDRRPSEAIVNALNRTECDLLMKLTSVHSRVPEVMFNHVDWNILRYAHCPVLLVKSGQWDAIGQVLAAVNAAPGDTVHEDLNTLILETAQNLARGLDFEMHLVSAYPAPPVFVPIASGANHPINYRRKMLQMVQRNIGKLADTYQVTDNHIHLVEGPVDWVIPKISREIVAEFVVLGSVARQGVGGITLGNTAEHILDKLNCDVMVVKITEQPDP